MRFDVVIDLISVTYEPDALGQEIPVPVSRRVYANRFSLSSAEFYDAGRNGMKPEREYQIRSCDYADERYLAADDMDFEIIRTEVRGEWTRLVCQRTVATYEELVS